GALSLILGERADSKALKDKNSKCIVEGSFDIKSYDLKELFKSHDLDFDNQSLLRREITPAGKSRAFINDTPVTLQVLKEFGMCLVDIHSQHQKLLLHTKGYQLNVVDAFVNDPQFLLNYKRQYIRYKEIDQRLTDLLEQEKSARADADYYQFQFDELNEANLDGQDLDKIESDVKKLNHAEEIKTELLRVLNILDNDQRSVHSSISEARNTLDNISKYNPELKILEERLKSVYIELKDIFSELESTEQSTNYDADKLASLTERLDHIYRLQQKHSVEGIGELLEVRDKLYSHINSIKSLEEDITALNTEKVKLEAELTSLASALTNARTSVLPATQDQIKSLLAQLGMPSADLLIENEVQEDFGSSGKDRVQFLFKPNRGGSFCDLGKIASGGELSRLMLSIKASISSLTALPCIIFDEIDTGVSGEIADKVGEIMKKMSTQMQVICITHLPQIASKADVHYLAFKYSGDGSTSSDIKHLSEGERIDEIAKMLSGTETTQAAVVNAKELLNVLN
ncbi:TPA: DNA repair protein RecN, partial [Candidatus Poribacteria bacterium]|nr:DNA repair protein RecN [Candidatus Poribacteria bacterium]